MVVIASEAKQSPGYVKNQLLSQPNPEAKRNNPRPTKKPTLLPFCERSEAIPKLFQKSRPHSGTKSKLGSSGSSKLKPL